MIFLRHPVTEAAPDLCYGRLDLGLGAGAEAQIAGALESVPKISVIRTSPLKRCRILADRLAARDDVSPISDHRLMEYDFGEWEGRFWSEIPRKQSDPWMGDLLHVAPPGGERYVDLIARVSEALTEIEEDAVIICHAGVIRAARMILTGVTFHEVFAQKIPFCTPIVLAREVA